MKTKSNRGFLSYLRDVALETHFSFSVQWMSLPHLLGNHFRYCFPNTLSKTCLYRSAVHSGWIKWKNLTLSWKWNQTLFFTLWCSKSFAATFSYPGITSPVKKSGQEESSLTSVSLKHSEKEKCGNKMFPDWSSKKAIKAKVQMKEANRTHI